MNLSVDDTRVPSDAYRLAFNVRNRHDSLETVKKSEVFDMAAISNRTDPKVQGILFVDPYFFVFVDGECLKLHKDTGVVTEVYGPSSSHVKPVAYANGVTTGTGTIRMSTSAEFVYTAVVPPSYDNFAASAVSADNPNAGGKSDYTKRIPPTVAGIVVQDGVNRPNLIEIAADTTVTARQLMGYDQWQPNFVRINNSSGYAASTATFTVDATPVQINSGAVIKFVGGATLTVNDTNSAGDTALGGVLSGASVVDDELGIVGFREYVPIGKQMTFHGGKLYIASADGTKLYHGVSGRPLDFMVPVNEDGGKIHAAESVGGVEAVAYTVSNDPITCLRPLNTDELFVGAANSSYSVKVDNTNTIFGEPTFIKKYLFSTGPVNQNSFVDLLGDMAFIDQTGIRSFNAVQQSEVLARNDIFSRPISNIFEGVLQDGSFQCAVIHKGYALFHMLTNLPEQRVSVVYDMATKKFVSLDTHRDSNVGVESWDGDATVNVSPLQSQRSKPIRDMAVGVTTAGSQALFAVTDDPTSYGHFVKELYGSHESDIAVVETKSYCSQDPKVELKPSTLSVLFNKPFEVYQSFTIDNSAGYPPGKYPTALSSANSNLIVVDNYKEGSFDVGTRNIAPHGTTFFFDNGATFSVRLFSEAGSLGHQHNIASTALPGILSNTGVADNAEGYNAGFFAATVYVDDAKVRGDRGGFQSKSLPLIRSGAKFPATYPVEACVNTHANLAFNYQTGDQGWKISFKLHLIGSPKLSTLRLETKEVTLKSPLVNQAYSA